MIREFTCTENHTTEKLFMTRKADAETLVIPCAVCGQDAEKATLPSRLGYRRDHTVLS